ncbi:MAG: type II toxin-antitoxin system VapC family toxin [Anaerolineaceae bacterium]|nr:type II toxin-antitoxin system VapC family toxin [Anaerolineaceae bacterium]MCB9099434.1 type II toxin-antitoxin system VapC family toxin [Anaerolineales bacterium]
MISYVLDTDHLSLVQRGHKPILKYLTSIPSQHIGITIVSVEEMMRGRLAQVRRASNSQDRVQAYHWLWETFDFLQKFSVLKYNEQADILFENFRTQKIKVSTQDLRIAAIALSQEAVLVTRNRKDFELLPSLRLADWSQSEV